MEVQDRERSQLIKLTQADLTMMVKALDDPEADVDKVLEVIARIAATRRQDYAQLVQAYGSYEHGV